MLTTIAFVPSAPVMVPELASAAASETADLRDAALSAAAALPPRWLAIGVAAADGVTPPEAVGTFAGYGADVRVALSGDADTTGAPAPLPLCALIAGWLRGQARPDATVEVHAIGADASPEAADTLGRALRAQIDDSPDAIGVLIVADGANTLTPPAPGGYDPESVPVQAALDDALAAGDAAELTRLPGGIVGRAAYQAVAALAGPAPRSVKELYRGAPYGVGYFVGLWHP